MAILDILFGRPLANWEEGGQHIGPSAGIPLFGLDALSSAAYGPEAALTLLIPLGVGGIHFILPISLAIILLLLIVFFSYRQTIAAYPQGGGSYTVATENLSHGAGLLAAASLMIDYVLTVAVGISAGVGALVSALPGLQPHRLGLCLLILVVLTLVNLRGVREAGVAFLIPTYLFLGCLFVVILLGCIHWVASGGHPVPLIALPRLPAATGVLTAWLLLKVFASGCTAMTGVEAVSNGVTAFRDPTVVNARRTLSVIIGLLIVLLAGIALMCQAYGIGAVNPTSPGYQSVLSQLTAAVAGRGIFYYLTIASILLVLSLSANTAFSDFPRLARAIALQNCLPHFFTVRGRRLLYSSGIYFLAVLSGGLLILFDGVTDRLIPLYAVGAFIAFTLSQAGMVVHWKREGGAGAVGKIAVNGFGAIATGITAMVVLIAKFAEGAWVTALLIPMLILLMSMVRRHYARVAAQTDEPAPMDTAELKPLLVILPLDRWSRVTEKGLRFALTIAKDVQVVHVTSQDDDDELSAKWDRDILAPIRAAGLPIPQLIRLKSPYRQVLTPVLDHVLKMEKEHPEKNIAVVVPELVVRHWWENILHNQRAQLLKLLLLVKGNERIVVLNIPWYLDRSA